MQTIDTKPALYIALDLGSTKWTLALSDGRRRRPRQRTVPAHDLPTLFAEVERARKQFELEAETRIVSCFEAGRDGFWLHRVLLERGWQNVVIDPGSIARPRKKQAKSDRLDAHKLMDCLLHHDRGESVWSVVRVPPAEVEDVRRVERERERLKRERGALRSRFFSVLAVIGVPKESRVLAVDIDSLRDATGRAVPPHARAELRRLQARLALVEEQRRELEHERDEAVREVPRVRKVYEMLVAVRGIGALSAFVLATESFGWREFDNTRQVGASVGLAPTPHLSDRTGFERGISKASRPQLRSLMVQLAWLWLRYQPDSPLSRWFVERFAGAGGRAKRIGIVALARKLYVTLWKYVTWGLVPDGMQVAA